MDKFKELVLYISQKCANDPKFGSTKLNEILYFSDFLHHAQYGEPITGVEYQKLPNGPAPRRFLPVRDRMIADRELGIQEVRLGNGYCQKRTVNLREPNLGVFTPQEVALIDSVIEALANANAGTVSDLSHSMEGWIVAREGETIPYSTVFLTAEGLDEIDIIRGQELAKELDLLVEHV
jgi:hypothetical protein